MKHSLLHPTPKARAQTALRLVRTKGLPRQEWLAVRQRGIGSSDAAAAVGLNPYKSQLELWLEKTGRDAGLPKADPQDEESPTYWGTLLEPIVATHYSQRTGKRVRRLNAVLQHPDPDLSWMLANIDREVIGSAEVQLLECKTVGINGVKFWREGVPDYVHLQVLHQLAVTGKQTADVAVLLGGQQLEIHRIERDEPLIARLIELERRFWEFLVNDTPPPADGSDSAAMALRCLYPEDQGDSIDFSADATLSAVFADLVSLREQISAQEKTEAKLKQTLQQAMGAATRATFETGAISWKKAKDSASVDLAKLWQDHPELQPRYTVPKTGSRRFLIL
jgi:putative phage-type endonuclease